MKKYIRIIISIGITLGLFACKKSVDNPKLASGAINVTNAVIGGGTLNLNTNFNIASSSNTVSNNASVWMPLVAGQVPIQLLVPAVAATATTPATPAVTYYNQTLTINNSSNYSLFLSGKSPAQVETVLINETYPRLYTDSVCGVRFINLAPGSSPVSVNVKGNTTGSEVSNLAYKAYSNFIQHTAKSINISYTFEFRDVASGNLITTYTLTTPAFHNVTLCLRGIVGGSPAPGVILNNDF